jgi:hypothetical protein
MTDAEAVSRVETGLETGCTANLTTTARIRRRFRPPCRVRCGTIDGARRSGRAGNRGFEPTHMTVRRAVAYGGICCLLAAWLASAASTTRHPPAPSSQEPIATGTSATETLASEVQAHAARLRERLASAPRPQSPHRNPFVFESRPTLPAKPLALRSDPQPPLEALPPSEPMVSLIGITEDQGPKGLVRTAIITGDGDSVYVLAVGEMLLDRYTVETIGADAVELKDVTTNGIRRLALR